MRLNPIRIEDLDQPALDAMVNAYNELEASLNRCADLVGFFARHATRPVFTEKDELFTGACELFALRLAAAISGQGSEA